MPYETGPALWGEHEADVAIVVRHPFEVAGYPPGNYRRVLYFLDQARRLEGVSFVSDLFGGCFVEAAMVSAAMAVQRICRRAGTV